MVDFTVNKKAADIVMMALRELHRGTAPFPEWDKHRKNIEDIHNALLKEFYSDLYIQFTQADAGVPFIKRCLTTECMGGQNKPCCESDGFGIGFITGTQVEVNYD